VATTTRPRERIAPARHHWLSGQHGAWAMLAVPFLLGIAASRPDPWQLVLAVTAVTGYLASTIAQARLRARRRDGSAGPLLTYGALFAVSGLALAVTHPALLAGLAVLVPAGAITLGGARPGTRRDLANSLAQVAQALVLVPAAALVSGSFDGGRVVGATLIGAAYLLGTVLVVRSVIRERDNRAFAAVSIGFHGALVVGALAFLPLAYAALATALAARAAALPAVQRRRSGTRRPLRPVQVGAVEMVAAVAVVLVAFLVSPG
jgi:hypothetical protein